MINILEYLETILAAMKELVFSHIEIVKKLSSIDQFTCNVGIELFKSKVTGSIINFGTLEMLPSKSYL